MVFPPGSADSTGEQPPVIDATLRILTVCRSASQQLQGSVNGPQPSPTIRDLDYIRAPIVGRSYLFRSTSMRGATGWPWRILCRRSS
jgi:hypothetical protein